MSWGVSNRLKKILGLTEDMNWFGKKGGGESESGYTGDETEQALTPDGAFNDVISDPNVVYRTRKVSNEGDHGRAVEVFDTEASQAKLYNQILIDYRESGNIARQQLVQRGEIGTAGELKRKVDLAKESMKYADLAGRDPRNMSDMDKNTIQSFKWMEQQVNNIPSKQQAENYLSEYQKKYAGVR